jgi:hypothetical protein
MPLTHRHPHTHHRQAIECRHAEDAYAKVEQGLALDASAGAKARLEAARQEIEEAEAAKAEADGGGLSSSVMMTLLRLSPDELSVRCGFFGGGAAAAAAAAAGGGGGLRAGVCAHCWWLPPHVCSWYQPPTPTPPKPTTRRPIPQLPAFGIATPAELTAAPSAHQSGAFGTFTIGGADAGAAHKWVALPQWKALSLARRPVALPIADCSKVAAVTAACQAKTDDDKRRMVGPGLLVVDTFVGEGEVDPKGYYLVAGDKGPLQLVDGKAAAESGKAAAAVVLFLARPPARDTPAANTSELLQV